MVQGVDGALRVGLRFLWVQSFRALVGFIGSFSSSRVMCEAPTVGIHT